MVLLGTQLPAPPPANDWRTTRLGIGGGVAAVVVLILIVKAAIGSESYEFLATQGDNPVTWNHCQAIRYQVNPKGAPADWQEIVHAAVSDIEEASGFVFADRGTTIHQRQLGHTLAGFGLR